MDSLTDSDSMINTCDDRVHNDLLEEIFNVEDAINLDFSELDHQQIRGCSIKYRNHVVQSGNVVENNDQIIHFGDRGAEEEGYSLHELKCRSSPTPIYADGIRATASGKVKSVMDSAGCLSTYSSPSTAVDCTLTGKDVGARVAGTAGMLPSCEMNSSRPVEFYDSRMHGVIENGSDLISTIRSSFEFVRGADMFSPSLHPTFSTGDMTPVDDSLWAVSHHMADGDYAARPAVSHAQYRKGPANGNVSSVSRSGNDNHVGHYYDRFADIQPEEKTERATAMAQLSGQNGNYELNTSCPNLYTAISSQEKYSDGLTRVAANRPMSQCCSPSKMFRPTLTASTGLTRFNARDMMQFPQNSHHNVLQYSTMGSASCPSSPSKQHWYVPDVSAHVRSQNSDSQQSVRNSHRQLIEHIVDRHAVHSRQPETAKRNACFRPMLNSAIALDCSVAGSDHADQFQLNSCRPTRLAQLSGIPRNGKVPMLKKSEPVMIQNLHNIIKDQSSPFRSHHLFPLLRDIIIADMNFNNPSFPFQLISNLPSDCHHLIQNYLARNQHLVQMSVRDSNMDELILDALQCVHSTLIGKIKERNLLRNSEESSRQFRLLPGALDDICNTFERSVQPITDGIFGEIDSDSTNLPFEKPIKKTSLTSSMLLDSAEHNSRLMPRIRAEHGHVWQGAAASAYLPLRDTAVSCHQQNPVDSSSSRYPQDSNLPNNYDTPGMKVSTAGRGSEIPSNVAQSMQDIQSNVEQVSNRFDAPDGCSSRVMEVLRDNIKGEMVRPISRSSGNYPPQEYALYAGRQSSQYLAVQSAGGEHEIALPINSSSLVSNMPTYSETVAMGQGRMTPQRIGQQDERLIRNERSERQFLSSDLRSNCAVNTGSGSGSVVGHRVDSNEHAVPRGYFLSRQKVITPAVDLILPQHPARRDIVTKSHNISNERIIQSLPTSPQKQLYRSEGVYGVGSCNTCVADNGYPLEKINKSKVLPKEAVAVMTEWLRDHQDNPYPNDDEKEALILATGLTVNQINYWFTNARRRVLPKWAMQRTSLEQDCQSVPLVQSKADCDVISAKTELFCS